MLNEKNLSDEELLEITGGNAFASNLSIVSTPITIHPLYGIIVQPLYGIRPQPLYGILPLNTLD